jgi:hypothetical protein
VFLYGLGVPIGAMGRKFLREERVRNSARLEEREALNKAHRCTHPFVHLTRAQRSQLYEDALDLIGGHSGLVLFAEAIEKKHPSVLNGSVDCVRQAFEQVITRFDAYLRRKASGRAFLLHV